MHIPGTRPHRPMVCVCPVFVARAKACHEEATHFHHVHVDDTCVLRIADSPPSLFMPAPFTGSQHGRDHSL